MVHVQLVPEFPAGCLDDGGWVKGGECCVEGLTVAGLHALPLACTQTQMLKCPNWCPLTLLFKCTPRPVS